MPDRNDPNLVASIAAVSQAVEAVSNKARPSVISHNTPAEVQLDLLASIGAVSELTPPTRTEPEADSPGSDVAIVAAIHDTAQAFVATAPREEIGLAKGALSVWGMIGRTRDERHYSDIVAALLNPFVVGPAAKKLFCSLMALGAGCPRLEPNEVTYQAVFREYDLARLHVMGTRSTGQGRIDVFARTNLGILVIENKVDAPEGSSQTLKYVDAVEGRYGGDSRPRSYLLLSPFPFVATATEFQWVPYSSLYNLLHRSWSGHSWNRRGAGLMRLFLDEVGGVFLAPMVTAIDLSLRHLRKAGYDI